MLTLFRAYTTNDLSTGIYSSQEIPTLELTNYRLSSLYDAFGNAGWQNVDFTARHIDWGPSWQWKSAPVPTGLSTDLFAVVWLVVMKFSTAIVSLLIGSFFYHVFHS